MRQGSCEGHAGDLSQDQACGKKSRQVQEHALPIAMRFEEQNAHKQSDTQQ
jgi:hypothetical protein